MRQKHFYTMELMNDIFSDCVAEDAPAAQDHGEARNRRQKLNILPKRKYKNRASTWVNTNKWEEFIQNSESSGIQAARNGLSPKTNAINHLIEYRLSEFRSVSRRWITDIGRQWSQESDRSYSVIMRLMQDVEFPLDRIGDILNWSKSDVVIAVAAEAQIAKSQRECLRTRQAMSKQSLGVLFYFFFSYLLNFIFGCSSTGIRLVQSTQPISSRINMQRRMARADCDLTECAHRARLNGENA